MLTQNNQPIDLSQPHYVSADEFDGNQHDLDANNKVLRKTFARTKDYQNSPSGALARLVQTVRFSVITHTRNQCREDSGIPSKALDDIEKGWDRGKELKSKRMIERLKTYWERHEIHDAVHEQLLDLLRQIEQGTAGFYWMMAYDVGIDTFFEHVHFGRVTLNDRQKLHTVPSYVEVLDLVKDLYGNGSLQEKLKRSKRLQQAREIWQEDRLAVLDKRTVPQPIAKLFVAMETFLAEKKRLTLSVDTMSSGFGGKKSKPPNISKTDVCRLIHGELVSWDRVQACAVKVCSADACALLQDEWEANYAEQQRQPTFKRQFMRIRDEQGIVNEDISYALQVKRAREVQADADGKKFNPASSILKMLDHKFSSQVPARVAIGLIARNPEEEKYLTTLFRDEMDRQYTCLGSLFTGERRAIKIDMDLNGVRRYEIAEYLHAQGAYQHLSRQELTQRIRSIDLDKVTDGSLESREITRIRRAIDAMGKQRLDDARKRWRKGAEVPESLQNFSTVSDAVLKLCEYTKGMERLTAVVRSNTSDPQLYLGRKYLKPMSQGKRYPPLPVVENMLRQFNLPLSEHLRHDWHALYPVFLIRQKPQQEHQPIVRILLTLIGARYVSVARFADDRMSHCMNNTNTRCAECIRSIYEPKDGYRTSWSIIENILLGLDITQDDHRWKLVELLYNGASVKEALESIKSEMQSKGIPCNHVTLPGLTHQEMGVPFRPYRE